MTKRRHAEQVLVARLSRANRFSNQTRLVLVFLVSDGVGTVVNAGCLLGHQLGDTLRRRENAEPKRDAVGV